MVCGLRLILFILALSSFHSVGAQSGSLKGLEMRRAPTPFEFEVRDHVYPNERRPELAESLWRQAGRGVYLSVGSERSFFGAAKTDATDLIIVDRDPSVLLFAYINRALLKNSRFGDLADYRHLRLEASEAEWKKRTGLSSAHFKWWDLIIRQGRQPMLIDGETHLSPPVESPDLLHHPKSYRRGDPFFGVNYMVEPELLRRLQTLAEENRIRIIDRDWNDSKLALDLQGVLTRENLNVSVLDLSNAWWPSYINGRNLYRDLNTLSRVARPNSLVLFSHTPYFPGVSLKRDYETIHWIYFGVNLFQLSKPEALLKLVYFLNHSPHFWGKQGQLRGAPYEFAGQILKGLPPVPANFDCQSITGAARVLAAQP